MTGITVYFRSVWLHLLGLGVCSWRGHRRGHRSGEIALMLLGTRLRICSRCFSVNSELRGSVSR